MVGWAAAHAAHLPPLQLGHAVSQSLSYVQSPPHGAGAGRQVVVRKLQLGQVESPSQSESVEQPWSHFAPGPGGGAGGPPPEHFPLTHCGQLMSAQSDAAEQTIPHPAPHTVAFVVASNTHVLQDPLWSQSAPVTQPPPHVSGALVHVVVIVLQNGQEELPVQSDDALHNALHPCWDGPGGPGGVGPEPHWPLVHFGQLESAHSSSAVQFPAHPAPQTVFDTRVLFTHRPQFVDWSQSLDAVQSVPHPPDFARQVFVTELHSGHDDWRQSESLSQSMSHVHPHFAPMHARHFPYPQSAYSTQVSWHVWL